VTNEHEHNVPKKPMADDTTHDADDTTHDIAQKQMQTMTSMRCNSTVTHTQPTPHETQAVRVSQIRPLRTGHGE
jgi:hypothetical protein